MSKIHFIYGTVNAAKTTDLITKAYFMESIGKKILCLLPTKDTRSNGVIKSRAGLQRDHDIVKICDNSILHDLIPFDVEVVFIDEVQFLTVEQIRELVDISTRYNIQIFCYGLKSDFKLKLFPAISELLVHASDIYEMKSYCSVCKEHKAIYNAKFDIKGKIVTTGSSISPGYDYKGVCPVCYNFLKHARDKWESK